VSAKRVIVWMCSCGNYYASSNTGDLRGKVNRDRKGNVTTSRTRCPDCGGNRKRRVLLVVGEED